MKLKVNEIFYSLQGEGGRSGEASVFIRLSGCNLDCSFCDTEFESGTYMSLDEISDKISVYPSRWIIWTGGEPTLQLTDDVLSFFKEKAYMQAVESNGTMPFSTFLDYTVCSPKGKNISYAKRKNPKVDEVRFPVSEGDKVPSVSAFPKASYYMLSPIFEEDRTKTNANIQYCVEYVKLHPEWRLSLQIHKLINIP